MPSLSESPSPSASSGMPSPSAFRQTEHQSNRDRGNQTEGPDHCRRRRHTRPARPPRRARQAGSATVRPAPFLIRIDPVAIGRCSVVGDAITVGVVRTFRFVGDAVAIGRRSPRAKAARVHAVKNGVTVVVSPVRTLARLISFVGVAVVVGVEVVGDTVAIGVTITLSASGIPSPSESGSRESIPSSSVSPSPSSASGMPSPSSSSSP